MSNQRYIKINGQLVPVTDEVYNTYYQLARREKYLIEQDVEKGVMLYSNLDTCELFNQNLFVNPVIESVEQMVITKVMIEKLQDCLLQLSKAELELIKALYFDGFSEYQWSAKTGIPRQTINSRKQKIISKLKKLLNK